VEFPTLLAFGGWPAGGVKDFSTARHVVPRWRLAAGKRALGLRSLLGSMLGAGRVLVELLAVPAAVGRRILLAVDLAGALGYIDILVPWPPWGGGRKM